MATAADRERRFRRLCDEHTAAVLAYALRRTSREDAADVVAETFLVAWRKLDDVDDEGVLPWLYAVARRVLLAQQRAARRQHAIAQRVAVGSAAYLAERPAGTGRLLEALGGLREKEREVLMLAAWEELSSDAAARVLGCSATAYRIRLHRARRRLRELLDQPEHRLKESPSC